MASGSTRVIFLNRFFYPDHSATSELLANLAFALSLENRNVKVISSRLRYDDNEHLLAPHEIIDRVEVWRVWSSRRGRYRMMGRAADYASFYIASAVKLWQLARRDDIIIAMTDPPMISVLAAAIARLRGSKLINWQQDVFPEVAKAVGLGGTVGGALFNALRLPRNWSLRLAHRNVVVGEMMARTLRAQGIKPGSISIIPNWSDGGLVKPIEPEQNALRDAWGLNGAFVVAYAGNLGRAHETETILGAMQLLQGAAAATAAQSLPIKFLFIGGGVLRTRLQKQVNALGLSDVLFKDYQPRDRLALTLSAADVHLVCLNPKLEGLVVPSKIYAIAAAGRPALFIGNLSGELAQMIDQASFGFVVPIGKPEELADRILQLASAPQLRASMGIRARAAFDQCWDKALAIEKWERLLIEVETAPSRA